MNCDLFKKKDKEKSGFVFRILMLGCKGLQLKGQGNITLTNTHSHKDTHIQNKPAPPSFSIMSDEPFTPFSRRHTFVFIFKHTLNASPLRFSASNEAINFQKAIHMPRKSMLMVGIAQPRSCT